MKHCSTCGKFLRKDGGCSSCDENAPAQDKVALTDLEQLMAVVIARQVVKEIGIDLRGDHHVPTLLSENEQTLADMWRENLASRGLLPEYGHALKSFGVPYHGDPILDDLAMARELLGSSWGCARDMQAKGKVDRDKAAFYSLLLYIDALGEVEPDIDIRLLWAIELSEVIGTLVSNDEDARMHAVNWAEFDKGQLGALLPDPIGSDFMPEFDGEVKGDGMARGDGLVENVQLQGCAIGKKSDFWKLGLASIWNPNEENKAYSFWKPVGLLKRAVMSIIREFSTQLKTSTFTMGKAKHVAFLQTEAETIKAFTSIKSQRSPIKFIIPARLIAKRAYHMMDAKGELKRPELAEYWAKGEELSVVAGTDTNPKLIPNVSTIELLTKAFPDQVISTSGLTIEEAQLRAAQRHADFCEHHMLWSPIYLKAIKAKTGCGYSYCPALLSLDAHATDIEFSKIEQKLTTTKADVVLAIWKILTGKSATPTSKGSWELGDITVSCFGEIQGIYREALGLPVGDSTSNTASKRNGSVRIKPKGTPKELKAGELAVSKDKLAALANL